MSRMIILTAGLLLAAPVAAQKPAPQMIGISKAVAAAERAVPGRALEAELDARKGKFVYEIELLAGNSLHEVLIDARTGRVIANSPNRAESVWRRWFDSDWSAMARLNGPLAPRLAALERQSRGMVREVSFDIEDGIPIYELEIAAPAGVTDVHIDARTGARLTMFDD